MTTSLDKFRKLLAAYEDEVQRKQHKMGKRVDPRDEAQPNYATGFCTFLRGGQTVVWSPSFEVIGLYTPANSTWIWGWADLTLDPKLRTRVDEVRKQGAEWGIDVMTTESLVIANEQQAWELATVATAVSRADAMYRLVEGENTRFLALFEGPPATKSSMSMRAVRESQMAMQAQTGARIGTSPPPSMNKPALARQGTPNVIRPVPPASEPEPTEATRTEIGQRLFECVPYPLQSQLGQIDAVVRAQPPTGPVGAVTMDIRLVHRSPQGVETPLTPSSLLHDAFVALWMRCRDRTGSGFHFATSRLTNTPQGLVTTVSLEW